MKKLLLTLPLIVVLSSLCEVKAQTVTGHAIKFRYDNIGQRTRRWLDAYSVLNKQGDTLTQTSPPDTITKQENRFLKDDVIVKAYPNPTTDVLTIENLSWKSDDKVEVRLLDITGKLITTRTFTQAKDNLPFSGLASGTYQVNYYLNGKLLTNWKIVRQ